MQKTIWYKQPTLTDLDLLQKNTIDENLGIKIIEVGADFIRGTMPADARTFQPFGLIHGGANVVLAETLGSIGANCVVDNEHYFCVGQEVNANHLRGVRSGEVTGTAKLLHSGRTSQVWEIHILDDQDRLSCVSRLTMAVVAIKK